MSPDRHSWASQFLSINPPAICFQAAAFDGAGINVNREILPCSEPYSEP